MAHFLIRKETAYLLPYFSYTNRYGQDYEENLNRL